jgi:transcriptional regulator with XRE-family HTH domain
VRRAGLYLYRVRLGLDVSLGEVERRSGYSAALISAVECGTRRLTEPVEAALIQVDSSLLRERLDACRAEGLAEVAEVPGKGPRRRAA